MAQTTSFKPYSGQHWGFEILLNPAKKTGWALLKNISVIYPQILIRMDYDCYFESKTSTWGGIWTHDLRTFGPLDQIPVTIHSEKCQIFKSFKLYQDAVKIVSRDPIKEKVAQTTHSTHILFNIRSLKFFWILQKIRNFQNVSEFFGERRCGGQNQYYHLFVEFPAQHCVCHLLGLF